MASSLGKFNNILASHSGRDKLAKLLQYGARVAAWYYTGKQAEKAAAFKALMGNTRRVGYLYGVFTVLPELQGDLAVVKPLNVRWLLHTAADVCDLIYYMCDSLSLLADYGIFPMKRSTNEWLYDDLGTKVWVLSSICWVLQDVLELQRLQRKKPQDEAAKKALFEAQLGMVSNVCNLLIGVYFLWPDRPLTSPMAGVLGMTSALIGLYGKWR